MLEIALEPSAARSLVNDLSKKLADWTGRRWMVAVSTEAGEPPLRAQAETRKAELKNDVRSDPLVQAVLTRFPGAEIVEVRPPASAPTPNPDEIPTDNESDSDA
jgi:DNA polymerase-3 subunit gamma/tau